jgi:hypothetical protein
MARDMFRRNILGRARSMFALVGTKGRLGHKGSCGRRATMETRSMFALLGKD